MSKSNAEMRDEITAIAKAKGLELPGNFEELKQPQLQELLVKVEAAPTAPIVSSSIASSDGPAQPPAPVVSDAPALAAPPALAATAPAPPAPAPAAAAPKARPRGPATVGAVKRPTLEEFVERGYKAEDYVAHQKSWDEQDAAAQATGDNEQATTRAVPKAKRFVIAPGRSLVCARGSLGPGAEVFPSDFAGKPGIGGFIEAGYVSEAL